MPKNPKGKKDKTKETNTNEETKHILEKEVEEDIRQESSSPSLPDEHERIIKPSKDIVTCSNDQCGNRYYKHESRCNVCKTRNPLHDGWNWKEKFGTPTEKIKHVIPQKQSTSQSNTNTNKSTQSDNVVIPIPERVEVKKQAREIAKQLKVQKERRLKQEEVDKLKDKEPDKKPDKDHKNGCPCPKCVIL